MACNSGPHQPRRHPSSQLSSQIPASCAVSELLQASGGRRAWAWVFVSESHAAAFANCKTRKQWVLATTIYTRVCFWDLVSLNSVRAHSVETLCFKDLSMSYRQLSCGAKSLHCVSSVLISWVLRWAWGRTGMRFSQREIQTIPSPNLQLGRSIKRGALLTSTDFPPGYGSD